MRVDGCRFCGVAGPRRLRQKFGSPGRVNGSGPRPRLPQGDALRLGMNWTEDDLGKPQVLIRSTRLAIRTTGSC